MKFNWKIVLIILQSVAVLQAAGCSKFMGPSDEETVKAIAESAVLKSSGFTVAAPIEVLEKGGRAKDGSWPVRVKLSLSFKMISKQTYTTRETTPLFMIRKSSDASGKTVWKATLGR